MRFLIYKPLCEKKGFPLHKLNPELESDLIFNVSGVDEENMVSEEHKELLGTVMDPPKNTTKQQHDEMIAQLREEVDSQKGKLDSETLEEIKERDDEVIKLGREILFEQLKDEGKSVKDFWSKDSDKPESLKRKPEESSLVEDFADPNLHQQDFMDPDS